MTNLFSLPDLPAIAVWDGVAARRIQGDRITLALIELDPDSVVPEHRHEYEQVGLVIRGRLSFRVAEETREVGPGDGWRILRDVPHSVAVGPDGATVVETFSPVRSDWDHLPVHESSRPRWPEQS